MRRLRIFEQLLIIFVVAVMLPICIAALIVTNVNQQAVRKEIRHSASLITDSVYHRLLTNLEEKKLAALYIAKSINYMNSPQEIDKLLSEIKNSSEDILKIELINKKNISDKSEHIPVFSDSNIELFHDLNKDELTIYSKINENKYVKEVISLAMLQNDVFKYSIIDKRQVYIIDAQKNLVMSYNNNSSTFKKLISRLPKSYKTGEPLFFGPFKNQPNIFLKIEKPDWSIIVITPKNTISYGIINARFKIILALVIAGLTIIITGIWYSISLYINIKQLFKAIIAIGKGNYSRRIRLIQDFFTPYEVIFLANEFNKMASKIDKAHNKLTEANEKLAKLDEVKSNLIDTVSHEFRTPLTSIKGYTSRLLRNNDNIDEETRIKSLKVIKQQTERLNRLVEDLLVIPDIESNVLRIFPDEIDLRELIETCILSAQQKQERVINLEIPEDFPNVYADPDRVEQVIINLLENAVKYSAVNTEILIKALTDGNNALIMVSNHCDTIPRHKLQNLFGKFTRLDDNLTRTTRGTGLGLYISKGLIEAMDGKINLISDNNFVASFTLPISKQG